MLKGTHVTGNRLRALRLLTALGLALALLVPGAYGALAQEEDGQRVDDDPGEPAGVERQAYFTSRTSDSLPPSVSSEFPPGTACLVFGIAGAAALCGDDAEAVNGPVEEGITSVETPVEPVQPVPPGALPVGLLGGHPRYTSYLRFELPELPEGHRVERLELVLHEHDFSFSMNSPLFIEAVRAAVAQVDQEGSPDAVQRLMEQFGEGEAPPLEPEPTGLEACPVVESWEAGENQEAAEQPERDCIVGATGERNPEEGAWRFDLSLAAQDWYEEDDPTFARENHGVYLGPLLPANLEYGDPNFTANFVINLHGGEAEEEALRPHLVAEFAEETGLSGDDDGPQAVEQSAGGDQAAPPPAPREASLDGGQRTAPREPQREQEPGTVGGEPTPLEPRVPESAAGPAEEESLAAPLQQDFTGATDATMPARMWLVVPIGLAAAGLFARALTAGAPAGAGAGGGGALTRLAGDVGEADARRMRGRFSGLSSMLRGG